MSNWKWLTYADPHLFVDVTLHRLPLYPLLLAASSKIMGTYWEWGITGLQIILFLYAAVCLNKFMALFQINKLKRNFIILGYLTSLPLMYCFTILTDSIFLSLSLVAFTKLTFFIFHDKFRKDYLLSVFLAITLAGFLRETGLYLGLFLMPSIFLIHKIDKIKFIKLLKTIMLATFMPILILKVWNFERCGKFVQSSGPSTALTSHIIDIINYRYPLVTQTVIQPYLPPKSHLEFRDGLKALQIKMESEKKSILDIQNEVQSSYIRCFANYPLDSIYVVLKRINRDLFFIFFNPFNTIQDWLDPLGEKIVHLSHLQKADYNISNWKALIHIAGLNLCRLVSLILGVLGLFNFWRFIGAPHSPERAIVLGLGLHAFLLIGIYWLINLELRYVLSSVILINIFAFIKIPKYKDLYA